MPQPHPVSGVSPRAQTATSTPALRLLRDVHIKLIERLAGIDTGMRAEWGLDHLGSSHPSARRLRGAGQSFEWLAVTFPGWPLWHFHLGLVARGPAAVALGVHWHDNVTPSLPAAVSEVAADAITTGFYHESGEHHADLLILASGYRPHVRAVQMLSDSALDIAHVLYEPLAVGPTAPPLPTGAPS